MRLHFRAVFFVVAGLLGLNSASAGQLLPQFQPKKTQCCSAIYVQRLADDLQDWPMLGRYFEDNQRLRVQPVPAGRVVFLGDSITDFWNLTRYFPGKPYVNRGISGQTTPQMLLRIYPDVIKLKPEAVVILAGTNDIAGNTGAMTLDMIEDNLRAITELSKVHGIKVIFCSLLPDNDYTATPQIKRRPPADILKLNEWLRAYSAEVNAGFVDYFPALADEQGLLKKVYSNDGLHPNDAGYEQMAPLAAAAIEKALR
jgi:lysophospholipase L1-like esterase